MLTLEQRVAGMDRALGAYFHGTRPLASATHGEAISGPPPGGSIPVFHQVLDAETYYLGFEMGSTGHAVLTNDQNRFSLPRSLPPILSIQWPDDPGDGGPGQEDIPRPGTIITRHAYSQRAFQLLDALLEQGTIFSLNDFIAFARSLAEALASAP